MKPNYRQIYAIKESNRKRLLKINPNLTEEAGIYAFYRVDEDGFRYAYIGQAVNIIERLCSHLTGYKQHIDLSIRKHGLWDADGNPHGYKVSAISLREIQKTAPSATLDSAEVYYIKHYADLGYQLRNVSIGGQGEGRRMINSTSPRKTYTEGKEEGYKKAVKDITHILDLHCKPIELKKPDNKVSQRQLDKLHTIFSKGSENE